MHKLESLEAWTVSRALAINVYKLTLRKPLRSHFGLSEQLRRAALSVPANVAEGYGLGTRAQLIRHLRISLGSAYELRLHLDVATQVGLIPGAAGVGTMRECKHAIGLLVGLLKRLGSKVPAH
jgi:four helix bundle protein